MTPDSAMFVIIGAGMAGTRAAMELRRRGFAGRVVLIGDEDVAPYDRVGLSKHFLLGEEGYHRLFIADEGDYVDNRIELMLDTRAVSLDPNRRSVTISDGSTIAYDRALLATGARPRRLNIPGAESDGVHYLRTLHDARRLRTALEALASMGSRSVTVIGAGFIGCEVASAARQLGLDVTIVGTTDLPMQKALGDRMATFFGVVHLAHGVDMYMGARAVELSTDKDRVTGVVLSDGAWIRCDLVVVGIGAEPCVALAEVAGISVDNGVVTDQFLSTSEPGIFAAGDVANAWHPTFRERMRLEHWSSALNQGPVAARNMMGERVAYDRTPFFFTDQYDIWMEFTGHPSPGSDLVLRGDPDGGEHAQFMAFWVDDDNVVTAGMNVNIRDVRDTIAELVNSRRAVDVAALADPAIPLFAV